MTNPAGVPPLARNPEQRLVSEYMALKFLAFRHATRVPLGPSIVETTTLLSAAAALRASRPWRPEVDAVVWWSERAASGEPADAGTPAAGTVSSGGVLLLIEGKVKDVINGIAKLPIYGSLVASTPELAPWAHWPIRLRLVTPRVSPWQTVGADAAGVEIDVFEPDWMTAYWEYRDPYWTGDYRRRRDELVAARRAAGLG